MSPSTLSRLSRLSSPPRTPPSCSVFLSRSSRSSPGQQRKMQCHLSDRALRRSDRISDISLSQWILIFSHKVAIIDIRSILFSPRHSAPVFTLENNSERKEARGPESNIMTHYGQYETIMMGCGSPNTKFSTIKTAAHC